MNPETLTLKVKIEGSDKAKSEFKSLSKGIQDEARKISNSLSKLGSFEGLQAGLKNMQQGVSSLSNKLTAMSAAGAAAFGIVAKKAIDSASSLESTQLKYETLLKSADAARERAQELFSFAAETPFELQQISKADIILQSFGIRTKKLLTTIGDAAAISGSDFSELGLILGQLSQSKSLENIRQLAERGVVSFTELRDAGIKFAKDGSIINSVEETYGTVVGIIEKKFSGGMKKLSNTLPGQISNLNDNISLALGKFAQESGLLDFAKDFVAEINKTLSSPQFNKFVQDLTSSFKKILPDAKQVFNTLKDIAVAVMSFVRDNPELVKLILQVGAALVTANVALKAFSFLFGDIARIGVGLVQTTFPLVIKGLAGLTAQSGGVSQALTGLLGGGGGWATLAKGGIIAAVGLVGLEIGKLIGTSDLATKAIEKLMGVEEQRGQMQQQAARQKSLVDQQRSAVATIKGAGQSQTGLSQQQQIAFAEAIRQDGNFTRQMFDQRINDSKQAFTASLAKGLNPVQTILSGHTAVNTGNAKLLTDVNAKVQDTKNVALSGFAGLNNKTNILSGINNNAAAAARQTSSGNIITNVISGLRNTIGRVLGLRFAEGGIVGGSSYSGDRVLGRLNSGEMVLNRSQQALLFKMVSQGASRNVNFNAPVNIGNSPTRMQDTNGFINQLLKTV